MANIYFFDPLTALETARKHQSINTNLQTTQELVCFYNGELFNDMPNNCISVPINDFYNYFFTTSHSLPQQINFDNQAFNDTTKQEITQSIINTLTQVKEARIQIIVKVLQAPLEASSSPAYIMVLLDYLQFIDIPPEAIEKEILHKLLNLVRFCINGHIELPEELLTKVNTLFVFIQNRYPQQLETDIKTMHLQYALFSLLTQNLQLNVYFDNLLQLLNDLPSIINDYDLVTHVFEEPQLTDYLKRMKHALFDESFIKKDILNQKQIIYKFFFLTNLVYGRGEAYQEMYSMLYPYFQEAIKNELDELAFYLYTPLLMSWNGTAQTQEAFKKFNDEVEKPLEQFISNTLITKYKLKPNTRKIDKSKPIKVAFLQERIINYSVHKVFYSLLKALKENSSKEYEFIVYDLNFMEFGGSDTQTVEELKKLGITYIDLHKECVGNAQVFYSLVDKSLKIRQKFIDDKIDILIGMNTRPEYNFLFTSRTAPKQIYWSHGNFKYTLQAIDTTIAHFNTVDNSTHYFHIPKSLKEYNPSIDESQISTIRNSYPKDSFILGTVGRLIKLDNHEYLQTVVTIMEKNPNTIFLACGSGDSSSIKQKVKKLGMLERFYFPGQIDAHIYNHVLDLYLDPFPSGGGESLQEYRNKGKAYVTLITQETKALIQTYDFNSIYNNNDISKIKKGLYNPETLNNIHTNGYIINENKAARFFYLIPLTENIDTYINVAHRLINDKEIKVNITDEYIHIVKQINTWDNSFLKAIK